MSWIWLILLGIVAGWIAGKLTRGSGFGLLGDLVVGVVGSLFGGWLFGQLGVGGSGLLRRFVAAVIGAVILLTVIRLIKRA